MPLKAIHRATGQLVESFSVSEPEWAAMRADKGAYIMQGTRLPAVLKQNRSGTRWFQARPGERDPNYKPESAAHEMAKIWMVRALRAAGYSAEVEQYGTTPDGEAWEADVYLEIGNRKVAIEVQLSQQTFDDYLFRTQRYARSGVKVVWLVRLYESFSFDAAKHKGWSPGVGGIWPDLLELPALPLKLRCSMDDPILGRITVHIPCIGDSPHRPTELPLGEFAVGIAEGRLTFYQRDRWWWRRSAP
jgi:hypothetical protein